MKRLSLLFLVLFLSVINSTYSAYLKNVPQTIYQPSGTKIECLATGDEFFNWLHTKDGYTIIQDKSNGIYYYAAKSKTGDLIPSKYVVGKIEPSKTGLSPRLKPAVEIIRAKNAEYEKSLNQPKPVKKGYESTLAGNSGTINNLVVFIRFSDESEFGMPISTFDNQFNASSGNSMKAYFQEVSYNQLTISSTFYPAPSAGNVVSYKDGHPRGYYRPYSATNTAGYTGGDNGTMRRDREHTLLHDAVAAVSAAIPGTINLDYDNDGYVDNVCFIITGSPDGWASLLWPHRWSLYSHTISINGKQVWDYNFQILSMCQNSVLCHEMFHSLGAPDLYHYSYDGKSPVGGWDIMEQTDNPPQYMGAWMKYRYGKWISSIPQIGTTGTYTLNPLSSSTNNAYLIKPSGGTQFFAVEYRKLTSSNFESTLPGSGLVVYRIDSSNSGNAGGPPDEVYVFRPGGTPTANGTVDNGYFTADVGRTAITDITDPILHYANGTFPGFTITQISSAGSTISFKVTFGNAAKEVQLLNPSNGDGYTALTPTFSWIGVDGATNYNLQVATDYAFSNIVLDINTTQTSYPFTNTLPRFTRYYWRVKPTIPSVSTSWSSIFTFKTIPSLKISNYNGTICGGTKLLLPFTLDTLFKPDNQLTVELSDGTGNFNYSKIIGSMTANASGNIEVTLPENTPYGTKYRYRIKGSNPAGTSSDNGSDLTVYTKPSPAVKNLKKDVCFNEVVEYSYDVVPGSIYKWEILNGEVLDSADKTKRRIKWSNPDGGSLKLIQTNANGCNDSVYVLVSVYANPTVKILYGENNPCPGQKCTYIASFESGTINTWKVTGGTIVNDKDNSKIDVLWGKAGEASVTVVNTNSAGCSDSVVYAVTINSPALPSISGALTVCPNTTQVYRIKKSVDEKVIWSVLGGKITGSISLDSVIVTWTDTKCELNLNVKNSATSCEGNTKLTINIANSPKSDFTGALTACESKQNIYTTNSSDCKSLKWTVDNGDIIGSNTSDSVIVAWKQGNCKLTLEKTNAAGCTNIGVKDVLVTSAPFKPSISMSNDTLYSSYKKYNYWFKNGTEIQNENAAYLVPKENGDYTCIAKDDKNCESIKSDVFKFVKNKIDLESDTYFKIYPNPTNDNLTIEISNIERNNITIQIIDMLGSTLLQTTYDNNPGKVNLDLNQLTSGSYIIKIKSGNKNYMKTFLKVD